MPEQPAVERKNMDKKDILSRVGGGNQTDRTSVNLVVDGKIVETAVGNQTETLNEALWSLEGDIYWPLCLEVGHRE